ncbi:amidase [Phenylobacterium sp. 20VBR1]|uniref:Amidase n=1 Tax=Phenylobacterium glaciei TaxID=2803784 RepID=A0A941D2Z4_9CAUL|nr:amidase [Phenylobacterium glaciei]MBR7619298.1 amidase [Phenylobacterium glaciei]
MTNTSRDRLEQALARIGDPAGEGARTYLTLYPQAARAAAGAADARAQAGEALGPLDGAIVSLKDLFDVAGEPTRAGSRVLAAAPPATADAPVVSRLREAGAVIVGKTNMVEFAFSGVGVNPHYGTPGNPADRDRVPGGSTSGGAVAVVDGMCEIAIGTDTGGSTRIPAALCGAVGFKPTKSRVPTQGAFPLSPNLDSVGPIAMSVAACASADAVLAGDAPWTLEAASLGGLKFGVPQGFPMADLDATVAVRFDEALKLLGRAGVALSDQTFAMFDGMAQVNAVAPLASVEAYAVHRERLAAQGAEYDPFVRARVQGGGVVSPQRHAAMLAERKLLIEAMDAALVELDALVLPTTPIVAPRKDEVLTLESFTPKNRLLLRNTSMVNFFDLCAISLPLPRGGCLPTGLMLVARRGHDRRLLEMAAAMERLLAE